MPQQPQLQRKDRTMNNFPIKAKELVTALIDGEWSFAVKHGVDTGNSPYFGIEAIHGDRKLRVSWHTRATGTYRLFSCMGRGDTGGMRYLTLTKAFDIVNAPGEAS